MNARAPLISKVAVPGATLRTLAERRPERYPVLLDSAAEGPLSRFSMLAFEPRACAGARCAWRDWRPHGIQALPRRILDNLDAWLRREATPRDRREPLPFVGGWFVYLSATSSRRKSSRCCGCRPSPGPLSAFALRVRAPAPCTTTPRDTLYRDLAGWRRGQRMRD